MEAILAILGGALLFIWIALIAVLVVCIVANIFLFRKLGLPGWWGIIPFWNTYNIFKKTWDVMPWFLVYLVLAIVYGLSSGLLLTVAAIALFVLMVAMNMHIATAFGKGIGYCLGLTFVPIVFLPILAYGSAQYIGHDPSEGCVAR